MTRKEAPFGRRIAAFIIDLALIILLFFILELCLSKVFKKITKVEDSVAIYNQYEEEFEDIQDEYKIYIYEDGKRVANENVTDEINNAFEADERVIKLRNDITPYAEDIFKSAAIEYSFNLFLASFIALFIIPLIFKEGRTIGKKIMKLTVQNPNYKNIKWYTLLLRYFMQTIIEIYLGILTLLMAPLVSLLFLSTSRKHQSLVDLICNTKVYNEMPPEVEANFIDVEVSE